MSKVKFLNKWKEENNQYSPTHEVQNIETDADLPSDEPSSPLSTYSLTFDWGKVANTFARGGHGGGKFSSFKNFTTNSPR